jgi:hypothetical protein
MENENYNEPIEEAVDEFEEEELSHTDKMVGVFTEPAATFEETSKFPVRTTDWLIPTILVILFAVLTNYIMTSNPAIRQQIIEKQMEMIEKQFQSAIDAGQMTPDQANQQMDNIRDRMEQQMSSGMWVNILAILIFTFVFFFILAGVYLLIAKVFLKGDGNYASALAAYGLSQYVVIVQLIVMIIIAFATTSVVEGTSLALIMDVDRQTIGGYLLTKVDPLRIWFYAVLAIALAKMFKAKSSKMYFVWVFGTWIGFSIALFYLAKLVPFLGFLAR